MSASEVVDTVDLFGVRYAVTDYEDATARILDAAVQRQSYGVTALAVHGLMETVSDDEFRDLVAAMDLIVPDGQPVRWAMNSLGGTSLQDRVYGPDLTWHVLREASAKDSGLRVFLFGSTEETCRLFEQAILDQCPNLIVDHQADRFRDATPEEDRADIDRINEFGAHIVLVGRGCPRQERWVSEHLGKVDAAMLAVGAAFDYGAGTLAPPPAWMQRYGLQWLFRLGQEPGRLWKRYLVTNSRFLALWGRARVTNLFS